MEKIYNQLSEEYNKLFALNINEFICKHKDGKLKGEYFNTFYPSFGIKKEETCDFLIIGQAPKGWGSGFNNNESISETIVNDSIEESNCYCETDNHTPIDWVNVYWSKSLFSEQIKGNKIKEDFYEKMDYYTHRSFFWNLTYKLVSDFYNLGRDSTDWSKKIVWSNLYKIAPIYANPSEIQKIIQLDISIELIQKEIEELKPKFCIVLTNEDWWIPFQKKMKNQQIPKNEKLTEIIFHEKYKGSQDTHIIVTTRPHTGGGEEHVKQILKLIK